MTESTGLVRQLPTVRRAPLYFVLAAICWAFALSLAVLVVMKSAWLFGSDRSIGGWFIDVDTHARWVEDAALLWHYVDGPTGSTLLVILVTVALLLTGHRGWAAYLLACAVGGVLISQIVKGTVNRARPQWPDPLVEEVGRSFPSGHSMSGIYVWAVVGLITMYLVAGRLGAGLGWALVVFGVLAAPSRLLLGVHWPADVVGGWMFALGWVLIVSGVGLLIVDRRQKAGNPSSADNAELSAT